MTDNWVDTLQQGKKKKPPRGPKPSTPAAATDDSRERKYALAALAKEVAEVSTTPEGGRNDRLNAAAFSLGQLIGAHALSDTEVWTALRDAAKACGLGASETDNTITSGIAAGKEQPRRIPEPRQRSERQIADEAQHLVDDFVEDAAPPLDDYQHTDEDNPESSLEGDTQQEPTTTLRPLADVLPGAVELAQRRQRGDEAPIPTPWSDYNDALAGGIWPGLHVDVAGTAAGKTQLEMQITLHAARAGIPVAYVGLELDEPQVALRLLGEDAGVRWSALYTGRCGTRDLDRINGSAARLSGLPVYVETGPPGGWPAAQLGALAGAMRQKHPAGPMMIVVDFLQLLGDDPFAQRRADLRERIGVAAYVARHVAREYGVAVRLVSSIARDKYSTAGLLKTAGMGSARTPGYVEPRRIIQNPDALVGLGKESGEIEYAADSVTVLVRWPTPLDNGERAYVVAVPKVRYAPPTWCAFHTPGWHFEQLPDVHDLEDLPDAELRGRGRPRVKIDDFEKRILDVLSRGPVPSQNKLQAAVGGTATKVRAALQRLLESGAVTKTDAGFSCASGASETEGSATQ